MSVINGIFERCETEFRTDFFAESFKDFNEDRSHRWISAPVGFGYQELSCSAKDDSQQLPYYDTAAGLTITADVRLDNRPELYTALNISKTEQKEISDSKLILLSWQKWGRECLQYLIGDYAFALWDERRKTIFCARDHIGVKPFYYFLTSERFIFASNIENILTASGVPNRLNEEFVVKSLLDRDFYRHDQTFFAAVKTLLPGYSLTVERRSEKSERFWFPENIERIRFSKDEDYVEAAKQLYTRAIHDRVSTTEKIGVHLSGGLDSSSITVLAARERHRQNLSPPHIYSWQPSPIDVSIPTQEYSTIEALCKQENLTVKYCPANVEDVFAVLKKDPAREPVTSTLTLETPVQREAAKDGVQLILSGWGGDESLSFDGSGYYTNLLLRGHWWRFFRESRKFGSSLKFIAEELFLLLFSDRTEGQRKLAMRSLRAKPGDDFFVHARLKKRNKLNRIPCRQSSPRATLLWMWKIGFHAERMESWAAHGAPVGITYTYPLLDRRIMEFVIGLPPEQFIRGKWNRWIMRKVTDNILPAEICWSMNKDEPVRVEQTFTAIYQAFDLARRQITAKDEFPSRASYFDMDGLLAYLQPEILAQRPRLRGVFNSLQFLDF